MRKEKLFNFVEANGMVVYLKKDSQNNLEIVTLFNDAGISKIELIKGISIKSLEKSLESIMNFNNSSMLNLFYLSNVEMDMLMDGIMENALKPLDKTYISYEDEAFEDIIKTLDFKAFESADFGKYNYTVIEFMLSEEKSLAFFPISDF